MIQLITDNQQDLLNDSESRRNNERYQCDNIRVIYSPVSSHTLTNLGPESQSAQLQDISIHGLSIVIDTSVSIGELLYIEIPTPGTFEHEEITAEVIWATANDNNHDSDRYKVGLKVISANEIIFGTDQENTYLEGSKQKKLTCSHCDEDSFFIQSITQSQAQPATHTCCNCGHSHYITQVIAFSRKLSEAA